MSLFTVIFDSFFTCFIEGFASASFVTITGILNSKDFSFKRFSPSGILIVNFSFSIVILIPIFSASCLLSHLKSPDFSDTANTYLFSLRMFSSQIIVSSNISSIRTDTLLSISFFAAFTMKTQSILFG